jgi:hypothetical protein
MGGAGRLFRPRLIYQSNPLGLQFRSIVVADFVETPRQRWNCRDLACLRAGH